MRIYGLPVAATLLLVTLLGACSNGATALRAGGTRKDQGQQVAPVPAAAGPINGVQGWPAFPGGSAPGGASPVRRTSGAVSINGDGRAAEGGLNNYADTLVPNAYVIAPGGDDDLLAYAWYTVTSLDTERPVSVDLHVTAAPIAPGGDDDLPLSYWVGVGDYTNFAWQWTGPYTTPGLTSITLNDKAKGVLDRYVSSNTATSPNTFHLVVATAAQQQFISALNPKGLSAARIETLTVHTLAVSDPGYDGTKPHYTSIEAIGPPGGGKGGSSLDPATQYVELHWTHLVDPYGPVLEAAQYQVYRQGPLDATRIPIGSVNAPIAVYTDPTDNDLSVAEPTPGVNYKYFLQAVNSAGSSGFDQRSCRIPLPPIWPMFGHDPQHTGKSELPGAQNATLKWSCQLENQLGSSIATSLVVGGGNTVYIADIRKLYAIDSAGVLQWKYELGSAGMVSPAITQDGTIIVSSMINADPYPHVIDALYPDGTLKWRYTLTSDQTITSAPTIAPDGTIYIGSTSNPILYAFNPDGTLKWTAPTYTPDCTVPAIGADGTIFVGCSFGLSAFNPDGTDKWTAGMTDHVSASVTVDPGGNTYLGSWGAAGQFRAMDPAGTLNWWWDLDIACTAALGVDGTIYLQTDFNLIAFNPDGSVKWNILNDLERGSAIAIGEDSTLYISGAWNGNGCGIKAYDSSGIEKWHWETPSGTYFTSPVIGQDGLIFVGFGKALYCFGP